jgi:hypothetical protein
MDEVAEKTDYITKKFNPWSGPKDGLVYATDGSAQYLAELAARIARLKLELDKAGRNPPPAPGLPLDPVNPTQGE